MDKLELEKLIQWKGLPMIIKTHKEELYLDQLTKYLNIFNLEAIQEQLLWSEPHIYKFIMRIYRIC